MFGGLPLSGAYIQVLLVKDDNRFVSGVLSYSDDLWMIKTNAANFLGA